MISDYLKKYSIYYLSRYNVTKRKFEDILKKKITKDYLEKKNSETDHHELIQEISDALKYYEEIGFIAHIKDYIFIPWCLHFIKKFYTDGSLKPDKSIFFSIKFIPFAEFRQSADIDN